jgi:CRP-like cAMP-binding protein
MDIELAARLLKIAGVCEGLSDEEAVRIAQAGELRDAVAGDVLIAEGDTSQEMFVFLEGRAEVWKADPKGRQDMRLGEIGTGDAVGELSMLCTDRRLATVRAVEPCKLFVLNRPAFDALVEQGDPAVYKIALQLARVVCDRMRLMHDKVLEYILAEDQPRAQEFASFKRELMVNWDF